MKKTKYFIQKFNHIKPFNLYKLMSDRGQSDLRLFENLKYYNLTYFSQKLFFNIKMLLYKQWSLK